MVEYVYRLGLVLVRESVGRELRVYNIYKIGEFFVIDICVVVVCELVGF